MWEFPQISESYTRGDLGECIFNKLLDGNNIALTHSGLCQKFIGCPTGGKKSPNEICYIID